MRRSLLLATTMMLLVPPLLAAEGRVLSRAEVEQAAGRVVAAFEKTSIKVLDPYRRPDGYYEWIAFSSEIESVHAVQVAGWHVDVIWGPPGHATAHLTLDATATGWDGRPAAFPKQWTIEVADDAGRAVITAVRTDEAVLAEEMMLPQTDAQRLCLMDSRPDLDRQKLMEVVADSLVAAAGSEDAWVFASRWAHDHLPVDAQMRVMTLGSARILVYGDALLATAMAEAALDLARGQTDPDVQSGMYFSLGIAEWRNGRLDRAEKHLRMAADLFPRLRKQIRALKAEYMYAYVLETEGELRRALEAAERLRARSRQIGWGEGERDAGWLTVNMQTALNNGEIGREYSFRLLHACEESGDRDGVRLALASIGAEEMLLGHLDTAREWMTKALPGMDRFNAVQLSATLAHVLAQLGRYDEARNVLDAADKMSVPEPSLRSGTALAWAELAFARKDFAGALKFARQAIDIASVPNRVDTFASIWPAQAMMARSLFELGRLDEAETAYRDAIRTIDAQLKAVPTDDLGSVRTYEERVAPYRELAELLVARGKAGEALQVAEAIRGRALREMIEQGKVDLDAALGAEERERKEKLEKEVSDRTRAFLRSGGSPAARRDLDQARLDLEELNGSMAVEHGRALAGTASITANLAVADFIDPDEIAVEYLVGDRQTLAFLVTRRGGRTHTTVRKLPIGAPRLGVLVRRLATSLQQRDLRWAKASRAVYDAVVRPIAPNLASFSHICVIPDGDLWSVPFDVLQDDRGKALIEKATISYSPSLLMLRDMRARRRRGGSRLLLAFANPLLDTGTTARLRAIERDARLGALPDAEREVKRVRELYGSAGADVHVGAAARESLFKAEASRYRILHIATHGMVDDRSPMYSCLVLAPDGTDDGLLEMREIVGLDLHADLAVLSACDTARGQIERGEGLVGIAWAFLAAGCPTTVVSQWKVDSAATEQLMVDFHRQLIRRHFAGKAEALRAAKLALMKESRYRHPFYWAPFIVIGNP